MLNFLKQKFGKCYHKNKKEIAKRRIIQMPFHYVSVLECNKCGEKIFEIKQEKERFFKIRFKEDKESKLLKLIEDNYHYYIEDNFFEDKAGNEMSEEKIIDIQSDSTNLIKPNTAQIEKEEILKLCKDEKKIDELAYKLGYSASFGREFFYFRKI